MANIAAIRSVCQSLIDYLNHAYGEARFPGGISKPECRFGSLSIGSVRTEAIKTPESGVAVQVFLYRVGTNERLRNAGRPAHPDRMPAPISIDLHFMFSFWASSAENEHLALAWTIRQLNETPILDNSILSRDAAWEPDDIIQLIPEGLSNEDMMRIWDALQPDCRLSLSYIARVIRIDPDEGVERRPVVATRFEMAFPNPEP